MPVTCGARRHARCPDAPRARRFAIAQLAGVLEIIQREAAAKRNETVDEQKLAFGAAPRSLADVYEKLRARLPDVLAIAEGRVPGKLIDIRSPDEYLGKIFAPEGVKELSIRAGHIPGAENVPWATIVNDDGTFKPIDEIRQIYAAKGVDGSQPVVTYCRIGERSSHSWFALKRILGYEVRNYDGSWTEYGNAVGVPVDNPSGTIWLGK